VGVNVGKVLRCNKVAYRTRQAAVAALMSLPTNPKRREIRVYKCGAHVHTTWHLTSKQRLK
jgi:hypothetical protein